VGKGKHVPCREWRYAGNTQSCCVIRQDGTTFCKLAKFGGYKYHGGRRYRRLP
jgi:hypothetical protein